MELKNWLKTGLVGLVLAGSLYLTTNRQNNSQEQFQKPKVVQVGQLGYNQGDLISYDFVSCSAVIFDYGNSAFMAHAVPVLEETKFKVGGREIITVGNVIDNLVRDSEAVGFNSKEAKVYVNAGNKEYLDKIIENLRAKNIPITEGKLRFKKGYVAQSSDSRIVKYSPIKDKISVFKESEFSDYREPINFSDQECPP